MAETYTLNTKDQIPAIGFGTWQIVPDSVAEQVVGGALSVGYRLIDTAKIYGNEKGVGRALQAAGLSREELFITTKLWNSDQGYDQTLQAFDNSLDALGLDYLDLYLIHWPASVARHDSWRAFEKLHSDGLAKAVGVSNYTITHLEELLAKSSLVPAVNQVEFHPFIYEQQKPLLEFCKQHDILIEAYSPLSRVNDAATPALRNIADQHGTSIHQVILRWCLQHDTLPLPRSINMDHIETNADIFNFKLSDDDMNILNSMSDGQRVTEDPEGMGY